MKKIINWTFGSVFRTFGRILAYLLIGILAVIIIQKNDLKLTDLFGITIVKADTLTNWSTQQGRIQTTHDGTDSWTSWENINGDNSLVLTPTYPVKAIAWRVRATNGMSRENTYTFRFNYKPTPDAINPSSFYFQNDSTGEQESSVICSTERYDSGYYWYKCDFTPDTSYTSSQYLYIKINFNQSYLSEMRMGIRGYEERKSTNAVITEQTIDLINNSNENTQDIINNINEANENLLNGLSEQNQVCEMIDNNNIIDSNYYLHPNGDLQINDNVIGITDYIKLDSSSKLKIVTPRSQGAAYCFYNSEKNLISCSNNYSITNITIPENTTYFRASIHINDNKPQFELCKNGNQAVNDSVNDLIHDINNKDTEEALNGFKDFFNLFTNNGHGLTSIITAPLNAINSLTSSTCSPLVLPLPYMTNKNITLPCMRPIYEEHFGAFMLIYDTITFGIISYWIILKLFKLIKNFKNPEDDSIEVVDL